MMMIHTILKMRPRIFRDWGVHTLSCLSTAAICFSRGEADVIECGLEYYACRLFFHSALCRWLHSCVVDSSMALCCWLFDCIVDWSAMLLMSQSQSRVSDGLSWLQQVRLFNCVELLIASVKHLHINFQVVYLDISKAAMEVARARAQVSIFKH